MAMKQQSSADIITKATSKRTSGNVFEALIKT